MKNRLQFSYLCLSSKNFFLDVASLRLAALSRSKRKIAERLPPFFFCRRDGAATRRLDVAAFIYKFTSVKILTKCGRGVKGLGCSRMECDQKREKAKSNALEIYSRKF